MTLIMTARAVSLRPRHKDPHPLATDQDSINNPLRRGSSSFSDKCTTILPSPSLFAAYEYQREHFSHGIYKFDALHQGESSGATLHPPRRHSIFTEARFATRMENCNVSSPGLDLQVLPEAAESSPNRVSDSSRELRMKADRQTDLVKVENIEPREQSCDSPPPTAEVLGHIPFQFAHDRLRNWGQAYLGNAATADVFVNAVHLRRPSLEVAREDDDQKGSESLKKVTIRARVQPKAKERKPFLIQRQFNLEELRASIPPMQQRPSEKRHSVVNSTLLRRSARIRRSISGPTQQLPNPQHRKGSTDGSSKRHAAGLGSGPIPIHVEYALHYLPVLAALMLSGHVRKGDTIDLPIPRPEAWRDVISYIYMGQGDITPAMTENILFLAGRPE